MARFYKHALQRMAVGVCAATLLLTAAACQEGGEAGDLLGQWRLTDNCYLSFSGHVALFRLVNRGEVFGNFQHQGDSLFIQCYTSGREMFDPTLTDTVVVEQAFGFKPFNNIRLKIERLSDDRLELSSNSQTWSMEKW